MSVTTRLVILVAAVLVPALGAAVWGVMQVYQSERQASEQSLLQLSRALAAVIDQELAHRAAVLETLARSPALQRGDLPAFYKYAADIASTVERTIVLADTDGRQLLNTRLPLDAKLPVSRNLPDLRKALGMGDAAVLVSDVYYAPVGKRFSFAVQVPVWREGRIVQYLSMGTFTDTLQKLLEDQRLRPGWNAAVADRKGVVVARRLEPERFVGKPGTADFLGRLERTREGLFETVRLDGVATITAYTPIGDSGWTFVVSMPKAVLGESLRRTLAVTGLVMVLLFGLAALFAVIAGRAITRPLHRLVDSAAAMGRGEAPPPWRHNLAEGRLIAAELERASEQIRSSKRELETRVEHAVQRARRAQEALLHNQKLEALGRLTGGISHDFNNLLQTISVGLEVTLRQAKEPTVIAAADAARRAVQNAVKLTRQLTTFGRGQASTHETLDLRDQALRAQDLLARALRSDIALEFDFAGALWPVQADPVQLELALLNAALNARDAMPKGGRLTIGARNAVVPAGGDPRVPPGEYVVLSIRDTGTGIAPEVLPHVFEPFFTTKEVGQGSGLGLAQIYGFATQSNGTVTIDSRLGEGTEVRIWLPRSEPARLAPAGDQAPVALELREPRKLLFVEDDALVRAAVVPALESAGFTVLCADSVDGALSALERDAGFDIVFSDVVMPGGRNGVDLAETLRERRPDLPVVLATGYANVPAPPPGVRLVSKPYRIEDIKRVLLEAL